MTAQILQLRDYKRPEERQAEIERFSLAVVEEALSEDDAPYSAPEDGDAA